MEADKWVVDAGEDRCDNRARHGGGAVWCSCGFGPTLKDPMA